MKNEITLKNLSKIPCLEDVLDEEKIKDIIFTIEINDIFDEYQFSDIKVIESKHKEYENCSYIICRECFKEILKDIEGDIIE